MRSLKSVGLSKAALGAVAAQFSQALASFMLTVAGVRTLSAADFGVLALLLGSLVLGTALMTGFVGDSLTILDRADPRIRGALQFWCFVVSGLLALASWAITQGSGLLGGSDARLFGLAVAAFVIEDTARRLLMATLRFWSIVLVDLSYLVVAGLVLAVARLLLGHLALSDFLLALVVGQIDVTVLAVVLMPGAERRLVTWRGASFGRVAAFGAWRAAQQGVRPGALTLVRIMVLAGAGAVGLGGLETARVVMSPALLFVAGTGSFLLATSASDRHLPTALVVRRADRVAALLGAASLAFGLLILAVLPWLGPLVTGGAVRIDRVAVLGWAVFAVAGGCAMPYASLAAVRARPHRVLGLRLCDTALSLALVGLVLLVARDASSITPFALAVGGFVGAGLQRWVGLASGAPASAPVPEPVAVS